MLMLTELDVEVSRVSDATGGDWAPIDDKELDGIRFGVQGEVVIVAEVGVDEVRSSTRIDEGVSRDGLAGGLAKGQRQDDRVFGSGVDGCFGDGSAAL